MPVAAAVGRIKGGLGRDDRLIGVNPHRVDALAGDGGIVVEVDPAAAFGPERAGEAVHDAALVEEGEADVGGLLVGVVVDEEVAHALLSDDLGELPPCVELVGEGLAGGGAEVVVAEVGADGPAGDDLEGVGHGLARQRRAGITA